MIIHTVCPGCGKAITLDLRHKEPYAPNMQPTKVAVGQCEGCRQQMDVDIIITPHIKERT